MPSPAIPMCVGHQAAYSKTGRTGPDPGQFLPSEVVDVTAVGRNVDFDKPSFLLVSSLVAGVLDVRIQRGSNEAVTTHAGVVPTELSGSRVPLLAMACMSMPMPALASLLVPPERREQVSLSPSVMPLLICPPLRALPGQAEVGHFDKDS